MNNEQYKGLKNKLYSFKEEAFGDQFKLSCCRIKPIITLAAEEVKIVTNAVDKRRYEFSAGRRCARKCLSEYGLDNITLPKGKFGEPVWPEGYTGSITHHSNLAIAVTIPEIQGAVGIDVINVSEKLADSTCILNQIEIQSKTGRTLNHQELILFSLKESVIKILSPMHKEYIEFKDIIINLDRNQNQVSYKGEKINIEIFWIQHHEYVFTLAIQK